MEHVYKAKNFVNSLLYRMKNSGSSMTFAEAEDLYNDLSMACVEMNPECEVPPTRFEEPLQELELEEGSRG